MSNSDTHSRSHHSGRGAILTATICGILFLLCFTYALISDEPIQNAQLRFLLRVGAALSAAGFTAALPGFVELDLKPGALFSLRAGGSLAIFALIYFINPPEVVPRCDENTTRECMCPGNRKGVQACSELGTWKECDCSFLSFCKPGDGRQCPCPNGDGIQSCSSNGMWDTCGCEKLPPGTPPPNEPDVSLAGFWENSTDSIQFIGRDNGPFVISGSSLNQLGIHIQVNGSALLSGNIVQMEVTLSNGWFANKFWTSNNEPYERKLHDWKPSFC